MRTRVRNKDVCKSNMGKLNYDTFVFALTKPTMKSQKELKEEYKQIKYKMGVFGITNKVNGKIFIGSSLDLDAIWHAQKLQLSVGMHQNTVLQKDWNEFGANNFSYDIFEEIKQTDDSKNDYKRGVKALEELLIEEMQPFENKGYNKKKIK